ncbi:MAG: carbohydrate ABC transporter permease [Chloroflexota bacterium]
MVESPGVDGEPAGAGGAAVKRRPRTGRLGSGFTGWAFVLPTILVLLALTIFPLIFSLALSFSNVSQDNGLTFTDRTLDNWRQLLHNGDYWQSLIYTTEFVVLAVIIEFLIGFGLALLLWRRIRFGGFFRVLFSIPMMLAPVAIGFMWRMLYDQTNGPIDAILGGLHLGSVPWLAESRSAFLAVLIMDVWEWTPFMFLLLLAGLQSLSEEALEAAQLDGATGMRVIWDIIFPMLAPISVMAVFLRFTESFTIFGQIIQLTGGGPGTATTSTTLYAYFQGYQDFNVSSGATIALSLLVFVTVIALCYLAITRRLLLRFEE